MPLELKILGALRICAKGCSFDAIAELSGMSIGTMQTFFHVFTDRMCFTFKDAWIKYPTTKDEAADSLRVYELLGFPGAVAEVDCVHVHWVRCPAVYSNRYNNGKNGYPTVVFEVCCNNNREILHVTIGHPGCRSDSTIVKTDVFVQKLLNKEILADVEFDLYDSGGQKHPYSGAWIITDGGYMKHR